MMYLGEREWENDLKSTLIHPPDLTFCLNLSIFVQRRDIIFKTWTGSNWGKRDSHWKGVSSEKLWYTYIYLKNIWTGWVDELYRSDNLRSPLQSTLCLVLNNMKPIDVPDKSINVIIPGPVFPRSGRISLPRAPLTRLGKRPRLSPLTHGIYPCVGLVWR